MYCCSRATKKDSAMLEWLIDWGLIALSAQIGYTVPLNSMLQFKKVKLMRKMTMLRIGNTYNKPLQ